MNSAPTPDKSALLQQLNDELDQSRKDHFAIQKRIDQIVRNCLAGLPLPDRERQIVDAGRAATQAFQQFERTLTRLRDFLRDGTIPDEFDAPTRTFPSSP